MVTNEDIRSYVLSSLTPEWVPDFVVSAIVDEIKQTYDVTGDRPAQQLDDIDTAEFWAIVRKHEIGDETNI